MCAQEDWWDRLVRRARDGLTLLAAAALIAVIGVAWIRGPTRSPYALGLMLAFVLRLLYLVGRRSAPEGLERVLLLLKKRTTSKEKFLRGSHARDGQR
jgi:hypothetical protein